MSMYNCLKCGVEVGNMHQRFMTIPINKWVPGEYYLCEEHKDLRFKFSDFYNKDGSRKDKIEDI